MKRSHLAPACLCALTLASCGGGERQDDNEPAGDFKVQVIDARFPTDQSLAARSQLKITVRNAERKRTVPNIAVTVRGFDTRVEDPDVSDATRPVFVIDGRPKNIGTYPESKEQAPTGGESAYNGTWALGPLGPGKQRTFRWTVTAVRPGPYRLSYEVVAGLDGRAEAVATGRRPLRGLFSGTIDDEPPDTRVAEDGRTVVEDGE